MAMDPEADGAALRLFPVNQHESLWLIDVVGEVSADDAVRWFGLLRGLTQRRADGVAVDLRACPSLDDHSVEALLATAVTIRGRGGSGVAVVVMSGSELARRLEVLGDGEVHICESLRSAVQALADGVRGTERAAP